MLQGEVPLLIVDGCFSLGLFFSSPRLLISPSLEMHLQSATHHKLARGSFIYIKVKCKKHASLQRAFEETMSSARRKERGWQSGWLRRGMKKDCLAHSFGCLCRFFCLLASAIIDDTGRQMHTGHSSSHSQLKRQCGIYHSRDM